MLNGALTILDRDGLSGFTKMAIGREAGVSMGAIYHRFVDRRQLFEQTYAGHRRGFKAFIVTGNDDPVIRERGAETSIRITTVAVKDLMVRVKYNAHKVNSALRPSCAAAAIGASVRS